MVDTDVYVDDGRIRWVALTSTLISSYLLAVFSGLSDVLTAVLTLPGDLLGALLAWIAETFGLVFSVPEMSIIETWMAVGDQFPIAGPLDFGIGVAVVIAFFLGTRWMVGQVREGL